MPTLLEYKCPSCGGSINYDPSLQKLRCPYCDTEFDIDTLNSYSEAINETSKEDSMNWTSEETQKLDESSGMVVYVCNSCGGEIICDETTAASSCPYCGNPVVMSGKLSGALKPDFILPFKLDKKAAKEGLKKHMSGKRLLPKVFTSENHIDEIKGIYVPFWLFDADVNAEYCFKGTKTAMWSDSENDYVETSYFSLLRAGNISFENVPVDGSVKMPDDLSESIEPFDFSQAVDFNKAYLAGFYADKYDVDSEKSVERANQRIKQSTESSFSQTVSEYGNLKIDAGNINLKNGRAKYALCPVWLLNTDWNGQKYTFAMNGQTGKFVGNLPIDKKASAKWFGIIGGISATIAFLIELALGYFMA